MVPHMILLFSQIFLCSSLNPSWGPCIDSRNIVRTIQILRFIKMLAIVVTQILYKKIFPKKFLCWTSSPSWALVLYFCLEVSVWTVQILNYIKMLDCTISQFKFYQCSFWDTNLVFHIFVINTHLKGLVFILII